MSDSQYHTSIQQVRQTIFNWLEKRVSEDKLAWLKSTGETLMGEPEDWELFTSFSAVPRHTGKANAELSEQERAEADEQRAGWKPGNWRVDELGRVYLLLCYAEQGKEMFLDRLEKIFITSDMNEAVALYRGISVYPWPESLKLRAAEGVRNNITTVFNAIALNNPYPKEYLDQDPFNQIVLKALFVGSPLYKIDGVEERANATLAKILVEYSQERRSAGRIVSPELWRNVGPFIDDEFSEDIRWVLNQTDPLQRKGGVLALLASDYSGKEELLAKHKDIVQEIEQSNITWEDIGKEYEAVSG